MTVLVLTMEIIDFDELHYLNQWKRMVLILTVFVCSGTLKKPH